MLSFRSPPEITAAIEAAAAANPDTPTRSEMIRRIVVEWLRERGYLPPAADEALRPDQLNSANDG